MNEQKTLWQTVESENVQAFNGELLNHHQISLALQDYLDFSEEGSPDEARTLNLIGVDEDANRTLNRTESAYRDDPRKPAVTQVELTLPFFKNNSDSNCFKKI